MNNKGKKVSSHKEVTKHPKKEESELVKRFKANPFVFTGTVIVLVIVVIAFVFVPAFVPTGGFGGDLNFGYYNRVPINFVPGNYFAQVRELISRQFGISDGPFLWQMAFEETVVHIGILDEMRAAGYVVPNEVVDRRVAMLPQFQENGVFSATRYRAMDRSSRMALWRQERDAIKQETYRNDMFDLITSQQEAAFIGAMGSPQRTFDLAVFPIRNFPNEEVISYANAHRDLFRVVHLSQITVPGNERAAMQVLDSIREGTSSFEEAARSHSRDFFADRGGDMGLRMAFELITTVPDRDEREILLNLPLGEFSPLIRVLDGWAFFRAEANPQEANTDDPSLLERIRFYLMTFERGQVENFFIREADEFIALANETSFESAITEIGMIRRSFGPIPINYGNSSVFSAVSTSAVPEISGAGFLESFWNMAFSTPLLTPSLPFVIGDNVIVLFPTEEIYDDEINIVRRESEYTSRWVFQFSDESIRNYFLNNPKLDNRFAESYNRFFQPH